MPSVAATPDRLFAAAVLINGTAADSLYRCIDNIEVNEDIDTGSSFSVRLKSGRNDEGEWEYLGDDNLQVLNEIDIIASFPDMSEVVISGFITHIDVTVGAEPATITVEIRGADRSVVLDREHKCRVWTDMTYEDIVSEILGPYAANEIEADVAPAAGGGPPPAPVTQRGTDLRFVRELARRKGYEFYVDDRVAYFGPPRLDGEPQKLIAVNFGAQTNCRDLHVAVDGGRTTEAELITLDPVTGELPDAPFEATSADLPDTLLGTSRLDQLPQAQRLPAVRQQLRVSGAVSEARAREYLLGSLRRQSWWITASGKLNGLRYGRVLRTKKTVTIKGLGERYNGNYYVRKVKHMLTRRTYTMDFEASRNAIGQLGTENFEGETAGTALA